ncbi:PREDICTED: uncharacterized protein LOC108562382 isoform X2 [Nicrophorus vespilloides]|nr:PREDICTED: uncharacterized protein LOC108562382 isoform X2 [Nicrophorus vespilloides]
MPINVLNYRSAEESADPKPNCMEVLFDPSNKKFLDCLDMDKAKDHYQMKDGRVDNGCDDLLYLKDLHWIRDHIDAGGDRNVHFNELFEGSILVVPKNKTVTRNQELEKRCIRLRAHQMNREYYDMVRNVDGSRRRNFEDSIPQMKKCIETEMIVVFQFIVSVLASFFFGYIGMDWLFGPEKEGNRIIRGVMSAFLVAVAEFYFLLKKFIVHFNMNIDNSVYNRI